MAGPIDGFAFALSGPHGPVRRQGPIRRGRKEDLSDRIVIRCELQEVKNFHASADVN